MNTHANGWEQSLAALTVGDELGPLVVELSSAANDRSWAGAGIDHPARAAGALYPPFAATLAIMAVQTVVARPLLQTAQHLVCHRQARAGVALTIRGWVTDRFEKRGRDYAVIEAVVLLPGDDRLWTSRGTFTDAAVGPAPEREAPERGGAPLRAGLTEGAMNTSVRRLHLDADRLRAYSRRGNFHADPEEARRLGLPGLVAQGMQVGAPAYGVLLDAWGEEFLAHGALEWKFVGMVLEDEVVAAHVDAGHGPTASITVVSETTGRTVLVGTARRVAPSRA